MKKKILIALFIILMICFIFILYINNRNSNKYILAYVPYKYIELDTQEVILKEGEEFSFIHNMDINEIDDNIKIDIEDNEIIQLNNQFTIKAINTGKTNLKIVNKNNGNILRNIQIIVKSIPKNIEVNPTDLVIEKNKSKSIQIKIFPDEVENKKVKLKSSNENIATIDSNGNIKGISSGKVVIIVESVETPSITQNINVKVINVEVRDNGATYVDGILLVNKNYHLPATYNFGVDETAKGKFEQMKKVALKDNIRLNIVSDYRSYYTQASIYNKNLNLHGERIASRFSAKPGQSEHQTGLAFDLNKANRSFVGTKEALWLKENCYKFGFIIRYPEGKESITGYVYEPWHIRYVGEKVAKEMFKSGLCLEEYLGVN